MYLFFSILIVIACVLLTCAVLIQKSKGAGLASSYSEGNQFMGYRKTTDFIEKATWSLAIFICIMSILSTWSLKPATAQSAIKGAPAQTSAPAPAGQGAPAQQVPAK